MLHFTFPPASTGKKDQGRNYYEEDLTQNWKRAPHNFKIMKGRGITPRPDSIS
jgi:hypothetical protein